MRLRHRRYWCRGLVPVRSPLAVPWFGPDWPVAAALFALPVVELVLALGAAADGAAFTPEFAARAAPAPDGEVAAELLAPAEEAAPPAPPPAELPAPPPLPPPPPPTSAMLEILMARLA